MEEWQLTEPAKWYFLSQKGKSLQSGGKHTQETLVLLGQVKRWATVTVT